MRRGNLGSAGLPLRRRAADPMADYDRLPPDDPLRANVVHALAGAGVALDDPTGTVRDDITREQWWDYASNRTFRQSLWSLRSAGPLAQAFGDTRRGCTEAPSCR